MSPMLFSKIDGDIIAHLNESRCFAFRSKFVSGLLKTLIEEVGNYVKTCEIKSTLRDNRQIKLCISLVIGNDKNVSNKVNDSRVTLKDLYRIRIINCLCLFCRRRYLREFASCRGSSVVYLALGLFIVSLGLSRVSPLVFSFLFFFLFYLKLGNKPDLVEILLRQTPLSLISYDLPHSKIDLPG